MRCNWRTRLPSAAWRRARASEAAGNHQVQDQPKVAVEADRDAFADPPQLADSFALGGLNGRFGGSQQKRARDANPLEGFA